ncbi:MAG: CRISPR-associated helicase Cas3' [Deltaproteobacteria bacterium]|nr:CRISPR-associated helicase Cas3' [Deltaproteobacteria bacterium]
MAHTENVRGECELLRDHLNNVAKRAAEFASTFGAEEEANLAGLLHDIGKYGDLFQRRLKGLEHGIDHWTPGAWAGIQACRSIATALAVQGHHIGLQIASGDSLRGLDPKRGKEPQRLRVSDADLDRLLDRAVRDGWPRPEPVSGDSGHYAALSRTDYASAMLDVRMFFSTLVDADFIETEVHFEGGSIRPTPLHLAPARAVGALTEYLRDLAEASASAVHVNSMRADLLAACISAADCDQGVYTLTAPTGTGKTLAMLAFALRHVIKHGLRRVVVVIPYLSIIDQTVNVYRQVFSQLHTGDDLGRYVLEHHSLAGTREKLGGTDGSEGQRQTRLLAENWDAPIIVTTSVQMLESLFANRPAPCRKLHRLARSVILFDEVQTIPRRLAVPTLATLARLTERYGSTVVFATATQPAFTEMDRDVRKLCMPGWRPTEIVPAGLALARRARRVDVVWPDAPDDETPWSRLVDDLAAENQILCVVNLKRHAVRVFQSLAEKGVRELFHLSTSMCPKHRETVLANVRAHLLAGQPCRLVSTQCVEAGVDLDFPVVFRAWGPLEAIVQAAGRCNRNGRAKAGTVRVFVPETEEGRRSQYPDGAYQQAADVLAQMLRQHGAERFDLHDPEIIHEYYRAVFRLMGSSDESELMNSILERNFVEVDRNYRIIDGDTINVLVPYDRDVWQTLKDEVQTTFLSRPWMTRARPYTVSLFRPRGDAPVAHYLDPVPVNWKQKSDEWFVYVGEGHYDRDLGLVPPEADGCWMA